MSFGSQQIYTKTLVIDADPGASNEIFYIEKAQAGLTILNAYAVSEQLQNAGTAVQLRLENWGTAGTAVEGTVTTYLGGTASGSELAARTPAAATVAATQKYIDAGEWLVVRYGELGTGWISGDRFTFTYAYVYGVG